MIELLVGVFVLIGGGNAVAQVDTGTILGTIRDQSGAAVAVAKVTLTNEGKEKLPLFYFNLDYRAYMRPFPADTPRYAALSSRPSFSQPCSAAPRLAARRSRRRFRRQW